MGGALLSAAVPVLLTRLRHVLATLPTDGDSRPVPTHRVDEVCFVLSRLRHLRVNCEAFTVAAPGLSDRASAACRLAGQSGCVVLLFPQLCALTTCSDARVRQEVRGVLEAATCALGL